MSELLSRLVAPIEVGAKLTTPQGVEVKLFSSPGEIAPSIELVQIAPEYHKALSTTPLGYRSPDGGINPEIVFVGDSFTFGTGLSDSETISAQFCKSIAVSCANLGVPGSGTVQQIARLKRYLEHFNWRPREVILLPLMTTTALFPGNDLRDNLDYTANTQAHSAEGDSPAPAKFSSFILGSSNLARLVKYRFGPILRRYLHPDFDSRELTAALELTKLQFATLRELACLYNFQVRILLLFPQQAISSGAAEATIREIGNLINWTSVEDSRLALHGEVDQYYYPFDGHFNPAGSSAIAQYLAKNTPISSHVKCD